MNLIWFLFICVSLGSGDDREICFLAVRVNNGIQHHNALFFNGFDAMLSNIGHGGGMADYSGSKQLPWSICEGWRLKMADFWLFLPHSIDITALL